MVSIRQIGRGANNKRIGVTVFFLYFDYLNPSYFFANSNLIAGCNFLKSYAYQLFLSNTFLGIYDTSTGNY
jgi:hypothetical protein